MPSSAQLCSGWQVTVIGAPRTKKTSNVLAYAGSGRRVILPSAAWRRWADTARLVSPVSGATVIPAQVDVPVNCCALFYREALVGDAVGFYQGLADLLERRGWVVNDRLIVSWDGSRLLKDASNPRVEVTLTVV